MGRGKPLEYPTKRTCHKEGNNSERVRGVTTLKRWIMLVMDCCVHQIPAHLGADLALEERRKLAVPLRVGCILGYDDTLFAPMEKVLIQRTQSKPPERVSRKICWGNHHDAQQGCKAVYLG